jgi:predicted metal-binding membrane protein
VWVAVLTAFILVEKLVGGVYVSRVGGVLLIAGGVLMIALVR